MKSALYGLAALMALVGCSGEKSAEPAEAAASATTPAAAEAASGSAADLSGLDVCALVPAEMIASTLGGTVLKPAQRGDYGQTQSCDYQIDPPGDDNYEYVQIYVYTPSMFGDAESTVETNTGLGQDSSAQPLSGFGDKSYAVVNGTEQQSTVFVLIEGKAALEFKAETLDHAKSVAAMALPMLKEQL